MQYTAGPAPDEPEIVVFGPGYGEAIAVHLGDHAWILVDSCRNPSSRRPASLEYLEAINVPPTSVVSIVASHWHDDHVRGISEVQAACSNATFHISNVFNDREAMAFLAAYSGAHTHNLSSGTRELYQSVSGSANEIIPTGHSSLIYEFTTNGGNRVQVTALSPTPAGQAQTIAHFAGYIPPEDPAPQSTPIDYAPDLKPNFESVVVHVDFGDEAILLGSDLEHHADAGWRGIVESRFGSRRRKAGLYKVAHHGSSTAEFAGTWDVLLREQPLSLLTPFSRGRVKLPTDEDRIRIREKSNSAFISSGASRKPNLDRETVGRLERICEKLTPINNGFGAVRVRRSNGIWDTTLFGDATAL
ncbi:MBL fold metallo-hydrolase [Paraburkholderia acidipaludis]|uniref:MBL fold metallo-hydrolase n=1 Tax=Paraburkholderia acidipaludis TaxID=660537 RepID=UPI0012EB1B91|nr:MBL fold metallo-hydrolase [Paraburkholderia acidipaludis]